MTKIHLGFDSLLEYEPSKQYYLEGSNPEMLYKLFSYIEERVEEISEINFAFYLFNNPIFLKKIESLLSRGIVVNVVSIPLKGYDDKYAQNIANYSDGIIVGKHTKLSVAEEVYTKAKELASRLTNFNMFIFPHVFIRSKRVKPFSRGVLPYSLHTKSFFIKYKNGKGCVGLTSSNFATRDEIKDNLIAIIEDTLPGNIKIAEDFFETLFLNSIIIQEFDEGVNYYDYKIQVKESPEISGHIRYIAPFYRDSPKFIKNKIIELIKTAKKDIYFCAQHIAADTGNDSNILIEALNATKNNVSVNFLSQTFVDRDGKNRGQRSPANFSKFKEFIRLVENNSYANYFVNENIHSKYIVIDDWIIITTCNFTPTEFTYIENVKIPKFDNIPNVSYEGVFSEVGQFMIFKSEDVRESLINHFESVIQRKDTYHHNVK